jgi:hypothetical protein
VANPRPAGDPPCYLFVDCDRFYFAVEAAERPGLAGDPRPVIIGRDPRVAPRGIVTTANDAARALGIHSGLSAAVALRQAPNALFLPPRHDRYAHYSARVMGVLRSASPLVDQRSIDEAACLWLQGYREGPALALRAEVLAATRISVSWDRHLPAGGEDGQEVAKREIEHLTIVQPGAEAPARPQRCGRWSASARRRRPDSWRQHETIRALAARPLGQS